MPYDRTSHAYDLIHRARGHDYAAQAETLTSIIRSKCPAARTLLDVASGTGLHLAELRGAFDVAGVDLSEAMLARARRVLPDVQLILGDMRTFELGRRFDAITCLFSSIGYLLTIDDVTTRSPTCRGISTPVACSCTDANGGFGVVSPRPRWCCFAGHP